MGGRRPAPNRRYGSHASRWLTLHGPLWLTAMVAAALVGHVAGAEVSVSTAAENEPGRRRLGEPCKDRKECGAPNSFCLPGKDVCACLPEFPLTDGHSQCGKPAAWNDSCDFSEQCLATTDKTVCRAGRCVCMYQMRAERQADGSTKCLGGELKYGDRCDDSSQCGFDHGVCEKQSGKQLCLCQPDYPVTNHINMCGKPAKINETCEFSEQCERTTEKTECRDGRCVCLFQMGALYKNDGSVECVDIKQEPPSLQYVDPTMIGVLVGLGLMFIILCVVLHLFSKARWRENRTIFNTPNPRLMNVSLLRDSKLIHGGGGSRRGSKGSNVSATSTRSPRSPAKPPPSPLVSSAHPHSLAAVAATPATTGSAPTLESVTVEIRGSRATTPQQQQL